MHVSSSCTFPRHRSGNGIPESSGSSILRISLRFFFIWTILKAFIEFVTIVFCVMFWLLLPPGIWDPSFLTRDRSLTLCIGKRSLKHRTTREVSLLRFLRNPHTDLPRGCYHWHGHQKPGVSLLNLSHSCISSLWFLWGEPLWMVPQGQLIVSLTGIYPKISDVTNLFIFLIS